MQLKKIFIIVSVGLFLIGCNQKPKFNEEIYVKSIEKWQEQRLKNLKSQDGWLNLVGLLWLDEGENTLGSDSSNSIIFPKNAPDYIGTITLIEGEIFLKVKEDVEIFADSVLITETKLLPDAEDNTTIITHYPFHWYIIQRGERYGIRLRDFEAPLVSLITEIPYFPIDPKWRINAKFEKFEIPEKIMVPNVLGTVDESDCFGKLIFTINGNEYALIPMGDGSGPFFIIFADETSAVVTYGAGRFLVTEEPDAEGNVIIDFNKAYNPPCAFTEFATCPLPPRDNILTVGITAGEQINEYIGHH